MEINIVGKWDGMKGTSPLGRHCVQYPGAFVSCRLYSRFFAEELLWNFLLVSIQHEYINIKYDGATGILNRSVLF